MGKRAKRREIGRLLKLRGLGKLYYGHKFTAFRMLRGSWLRCLLHKLQFKPGDILNDCDMLNHRMVRFVVDYSTSKNWLDSGHGARVIELDQVEFDDGSWSCGCSYSPVPAWTREEIESNMLDYLLSDMHGNSGWMTPRDVIIRDVLKRGEHICNADGILLPQYQTLKNSV